MRLGVKLQHHVGSWTRIFTRRHPVIEESFIAIPRCQIDHICLYGEVLLAWSIVLYCVVCYCRDCYVSTPT